MGGGRSRGRGRGHPDRGPTAQRPCKYCDKLFSVNGVVNHEKSCAQKRGIREAEAALIAESIRGESCPCPCVPCPISHPL